jgi:hypothetical protein
MLNSIEAYADCGRKAAIARNENDESRAMFETHYCNRMVALESPHDRAIAKEAFAKAYRTARNVKRLIP